MEYITHILTYCFEENIVLQRGLKQAKTHVLRATERALRYIPKATAGYKNIDMTGHQDLLST
jgi:hypothetical protein